MVYFWYKITEEVLQVDFEKLLNQHDEKKKMKPIDVEKYRKSIDRVLGRYEFTKGQQEAIDMFLGDVASGFSEKRVRVVSGRSGVGKSLTLSVINELCRVFGIVYATCAYTGKASDVLKNKGIADAKTIHSTMYRANVCQDTGKILGWSKASSLDIDILFLDEFSLIDSELKADIESYGVPVYYFGDPFQLSPVTSRVEVDWKEDVFLNEVLRCAEDSFITVYANKIRDGAVLRAGIREVNDSGMFVTLHKERDIELIDRLKTKVSMCICGKNDFRRKMNKEIRERLGREDYLEVGEKLIILKNNNNMGVFNGQTIVVEKLVGEPYRDRYGFLIQKIESDIGTLPICIEMLLNPDYDFEEQLRESKSYKNALYNPPAFVDFSYCISSFKSQGSQAESVLVFANDFNYVKHMYKGDKEKGLELYARHLYTSSTRAERNVFIVLDN